MYILIFNILEVQYLKKTHELLISCVNNTTALNPLNLGLISTLHDSVFGLHHDCSYFTQIRTIYTVIDAVCIYFPLGLGFNNLTTPIS